METTNSAYTLGIASAEIIILLLLAFGAGTLLCRVLRSMGICCKRTQPEDDIYAIPPKEPKIPTVEHSINIKATTDPVIPVRTAKPSNFPVAEIDPHTPIVNTAHTSTDEYALRDALGLAPAKTVDLSHLGVKTNIHATHDTTAAPIPPLLIDPLDKHLEVSSWKNAVETAPKPEAYIFNGYEIDPHRVIPSDNLGDDVIWQADSLDSGLLNNPVPNVEEASLFDNLSDKAESLLDKLDDKKDDAIDALKGAGVAVVTAVSGWRLFNWNNVDPHQAIPTGNYDDISWQEDSLDSGLLEGDVPTTKIVVEDSANLLDKLTDKAQDTYQELKAKAANLVDDAKDLAAKAADTVEDTTQAVTTSVKEDAQDAKEVVKDAGEALATQSAKVADAVKDKAADVAETVADKTADVKDAVQDKAAEIKADAQHLVAEVKADAAQAAEVAQDKALEVRADTKLAVIEAEAKVDDTVEVVQDKATEAAETVTDKAADIKDAVQDKAAAIKSEVQAKAENLTEAAQDKAADLKTDAQHLLNTAETEVAVAEVKGQGFFAGLVAEAKEGWDALKDKAADLSDDAKAALAHAADKAEDLADAAKAKTASLVDSAQETAHDAKLAAGEAVEAVKDKAADVAETVADKTADVKDAVQDKATEIKADAQHLVAEVKADAAQAAEVAQDKALEVRADTKLAVIEAEAKVDDTVEVVQDKAAEVADAVQDKAAEVAEAAQDKAAEVAETVTDKATEVKADAQHLVAEVKADAAQAANVVADKTADAVASVEDKANELKTDAAVALAELKTEADVPSLGVTSAVPTVGLAASAVAAGLNPHGYIPSNYLPDVQWQKDQLDADPHRPITDEHTQDFLSNLLHKAKEKVEHLSEKLPEPAQEWVHKAVDKVESLSDKALPTANEYLHKAKDKAEAIGDKAIPAASDLLGKAHAKVGELSEKASADSHAHDWLHAAQGWLQKARDALDHLGDQADVEINHLKASEQDEGDDFKRLYGIDITLEALLHSRGIVTYQQLADTSADDLKQILLDQGEPMCWIDPTSWPIQARLAANKDWTHLAGYQHNLKEAARRAKQES
jgi:predicted flap endonuclease-1-like 5' DNA nuclease/gas vesicle protein